MQEQDKFKAAFVCSTLPSICSSGTFAARGNGFIFNCLGYFFFSHEFVCRVFEPCKILASLISCDCELHSLTMRTLKSYIFSLDWTCHSMYLSDIQVCVYINVLTWIRNVILKQIWSSLLSRLGFDTVRRSQCAARLLLGKTELEDEPWEASKHVPPTKGHFHQLTGQD